MARPPRGKAVIGQSGGPTGVINQSLVGAIQECLKADIVTDVYGTLHGVDGILSQNFIDLGKQSPATLETVANTPSAGLGSVRKKPSSEKLSYHFLDVHLKMSSSSTLEIDIRDWEIRRSGD